MAKYFSPEIETASRDYLHAIQSARLIKTVKRCYENIPFYKAKFDEMGLKPEDIHSIDDIGKLPFTVKQDLRDHYPFGLFAVPREELVRVHASSGTTGKQTVVGYTRGDIDRWSECAARALTAAGTTPSDYIHVSYGYGLFTGALGLHYGLEKIGATVVPCSSGNTEKQVMLMKDFGTTALVATPSYAMRIGEVAEEMGIGRDELKLRLGLFGSEGCTPEMRAQIEDYLHLLATDNYGMSELMGPGVSGECSLRCGMHFNEDHFLPEIINSETGEVLPEGSKGELVITTLSKEAIPVLRYRTKDITSITYEKCECGRTHARMSKPSGRSDDMLKIRGVNVFPSQIESVIMTIPQIAPHYQLVVTREGSSDRLEVKCELVDGSVLESLESLSNLQKNIRHNLKTVLGIDTKVTLVEPKTIERFEGKAKRVIDLRNK